MLTSLPFPSSVYIDAKFAEAERLVALNAQARSVYRRLAVLRTRLATEAGLKPYHVYTNRQLIALSEQRPIDLNGLTRISGFGQKRLMEYGDLILASIRKEGAESALLG